MQPHRPTPPPPALATLHQRPSWLTTPTGRHRADAPKLDRAACIAVTAGQLAKRVHPHDWQPTHPYRSPRLRSCREAARPECRAAVTLHAPDLEQLAARRPARQLVGDYRTARAHAMQWPGRPDAEKTSNTKKPNPPSTPGRASNPTSQTSHRTSLPAPDHGLPANPNRLGVKHLGLPRHWSQRFTLEKHRHHAALLYPYLICPITKQRCKMLLLPLATADELRDSRLALSWLHTIYDPAPNHLRRRLQPHATALLNRYELLFPPRQLRSRAALRLTYGEARRKH